MATEKRLQTRKTEEQKDWKSLQQKRGARNWMTSTVKPHFPPAVIIQPIYLKDGRLTECDPLT